MSIEKKCQDLELIPLHILQQAEQITASGLTSQTRSNYAAGLLRWHQFPSLCVCQPQKCFSQGLSVLMAGSVLGSTIRSWLSGIRAWHILNRAPWPSNSEFITLAHRAANIKGSLHKRPLCNPITLQHLLVLHSALNFSTPFHCAIWAIA
ncbi:hypothetical protein EV359DRAFT_2832, partial [Lentinula novae-zelandiae]